MLNPSSKSGKCLAVWPILSDSVPISKGPLWRWAGHVRSNRGQRPVRPGRMVPDGAGWCREDLWSETAKVNCCSFGTVCNSWHMKVTIFLTSIKLFIWTFLYTCFILFHHIFHHYFLSFSQSLCPVLTQTFLWVVAMGTSSSCSSCTSAGAFGAMAIGSFQRVGLQWSNRSNATGVIWDLGWGQLRMFHFEHSHWAAVMKL